MKIISKNQQAKGAFNGGEIVENKPVGFMREGGVMRPYSSIFYWANAIATADSTIGLHPHQGFEIMSFVLEGQIKHYDTQAQEWMPLQEGDVQIIRSGSGISHSEFMAKGGRMFQIWLDPDLSKTMEQPATYDDYKQADFDKVMQEGIRITPYVGAGGPISVDTADTVIQRWEILENVSLSVPSGRLWSLYVLDGELSFNNEQLAKDDFIIVEAAETIDVTGQGTLFMIESPIAPTYLTYGQMMQQRMST